MLKTKDKNKLLQYLKFVLPTLEENKKENGYIWINNSKTNFKQQIYFNSYQDAIEIIEKYRNNSCYVGLATTDGNGYKVENLISRNTILIDIDKENLDIKDIYNLCKKKQVFAHQIVKSGRGWHIYLKLDKSYSIAEIVEVNRQLVELFDADLNACTSTQIVRIPYTKNFKTNTYASLITTENTVIKPYKLSDLKSHKATEFITNNTELQIDSIEDVYCFTQLVKHGVSKGSRNQALIFISSTCKYADLSENKALQYALEFNSNCKEQQTKAEVKKVVKSVYDNISLVKPCTNKFASKFCSSSCKVKVISVADVLNKVELTIDNKTLGLTSKHIITKVKDSKTGVKKIMLQVLTGSDLIIIATLKILSHHVHTLESLIEFTKLSKPTVIKALKHLEELNIINTSKQTINKGTKPTNVYFYNFEYEKYNAEILHLNTNLFTARLQKLIKDNDLKVAIAIRYLIKNNQETTLEEIEFLTGIDSKIINRSINNLVKVNLLVVNKLKSQTGHSNVYDVFY